MSKRWPDVVVDPAETMPRGVYTFHRVNGVGAEYTEHATMGIWYFSSEMPDMWAKRQAEEHRKLGFTTETVNELG